MKNEPLRGKIEFEPVNAGRRIEEPLHGRIYQVVKNTK